eukprot:1147476-Pelagomonas_calceolata.AAC.1
MSLACQLDSSQTELFQVASDCKQKVQYLAWQQFKAAQRQRYQKHADLCKNISGEAVTSCTILLGVGRTCYTEHTLNQFKQLGLDHQLAIAIRLARKLHAHPALCANKLVTASRAIENTNTSHSQVLARQLLLVTHQIPISTFRFAALWWRGLTALLSQHVSYSMVDVEKISSVYVDVLCLAGFLRYRFLRYTVVFQMVT